MKCIIKKAFLLCITMHTLSCLALERLNKAVTWQRALVAQKAQQAAGSAASYMRLPNFLTGGAAGSAVGITSTLAALKMRNMYRRMMEKTFGAQTVQRLFYKELEADPVRFILCTLSSDRVSDQEKRTFIDGFLQFFSEKNIDFERWFTLPMLKSIYNFIDKKSKDMSAGAGRLMWTGFAIREKIAIAIARKYYRPFMRRGLDKLRNNFDVVLSSRESEAVIQAWYEYLFAVPDAWKISVESAKTAKTIFDGKPFKQLVARFEPRNAEGAVMLLEGKNILEYMLQQGRIHGLDPLFNQLRGWTGTGSVGNQYYLLQLVKSANRGDRDALVKIAFLRTLGQNYSLQDAADIVREMTSSSDVVRGRAVLQWQATWQREGTVQKQLSRDDLAVVLQRAKLFITEKTILDKRNLIEEQKRAIKKKLFELLSTLNQIEHSRLKEIRREMSEMEQDVGTHLTGIA